MPRPTLKLPAKNTPDTDGELRPRKPVRGGFKAPKQSAAQHASSKLAKAARQQVAPAPAPDGRTNATPRSKADETSARRSAPEKVRTESKDWNREAPAPREVRPADGRAAAERRPPRAAEGRFGKERPNGERPARRSDAYPKRGIARSTGARAFAPAPIRSLETGIAPREAALPIPAPVATSEATPPAGEMPAAKRPLNEPPRLAKRVSEMGLCSRREADEWIENGWVRVDGVVVTKLGTRVHPNARIEIKDEASKHQSESVTILLNKPAGHVSGKTEDGRRGALELLRPENRWSEDGTAFQFKATHLRGLALAGKLDIDSTGMVVFTQEGSVARRLTGDETRLEKEYLVKIEGELSPEGLKRLNHGLSLDEIKLKRAQVSWQNEAQLRFVLHESRKRQIERMCELVGVQAISIKRIRIGSVSLGKLPAGQWRYLRENERF